MSVLDEKTELFFKALVKLDKKKRRKERKNRVRSDMEGLELRSKFDEYYDNSFSAFRAVVEETNTSMPLPDKSLDEIYSTADMTRFHPVLSEYLAIPFALSKFLDYATNSRGKYDDIAKFCNIIALLRGASNELSDEYKIAWAQCLTDLYIIGIESHMSDGSTEASGLLYWLSYDVKNERMSFNLYQDIIDATKGSLGDFKSLLAGLWLFQATKNEDAMDIYYDSVLKATKK